jgi:peptidoglycan/LPS O-acetylase OafA/YrhL
VETAILTQAGRPLTEISPACFSDFSGTSSAVGFLPQKGFTRTHSATSGPPCRSKNLTLGNFLGNLLFLQTILCETFGSNGPLWSLANEFCYYVLFPVSLGAGLSCAKGRLPMAIPLAGLAVLTAIFVGRDMLIGFLIWLAGCGVVFLHSRVKLRSRLAAFGMLCFFPILSGVTLAVVRVL